MIITKLIGGLGNQMFQYAVARSLAQVRKSEFMLDLSAFDSREGYDTIRKYELGCFNIVENIAQRGMIPEFTKKSFLKRYAEKTFPFLQKNIYIKEKSGFQFDPNLFYLKGNIYLEGYWQSEKYFKNIEGIIRDDFKFRVKPNEKNAQVLNEIKNGNSVAVHVRRGDYALNPITKDFHGVCSLDYYHKSVEFIAKKVDGPLFFIFSDDSNWSRENIKTGYSTTYVSHNGPDAGCEDLRLMMECRHFIIANSSFSWWGAWLAPFPDKIVIAPKTWIQKKGLETPDLFPESWIKI